MEIFTFTKSLWMETTATTTQAENPQDLTWQELLEKHLNGDIIMQYCSEDG